MIKTKESMQQTMQTTALPQRGIYSEVINPDNAQTFGKEILQGPSEKIIIRVNKIQSKPKALSRKFQQQQQIRKKSTKDIFVQHTDIISVDPKVLEPFDPIPGRVPRKVAIDRKRKEYASFNIENLLLQQSVDYNQPIEYVQWLPLELFDDKTFDDFPCEKWVQKYKDEKNLYHALIGKGLYKSSNGIYIWRPILILDYIKEKDIFIGKWIRETHVNVDGSIIYEEGKYDEENEFKPFEISRINFVLDAEDPRKFAIRVAKTHQQRIYADSLVRYNYYIDNMPTQDLNELDSEQKKRLEQLAKTKKLENIEPTTLIMEVNQDYMRTMNKIIFNRFLEDNEIEMSNPEMFPIELKLPQDENMDKLAPEFGMVQIDRSKGAFIVLYNYHTHYNAEPKDFTEIFKDFCFASLYIKEEVIKALQKIKLECDKVLEKEMFNFHDLPKVVRLEEFKHIQDSSISQMMYHLKGTWTTELIRIIKKKFSKVGKGWFNMKETSKITYDFGKLKRFLTLVRLKMQDTLMTLVKRCYYDYYDYFCSFIPEKVEVISSNEVKNIYEDPIKTNKKIRQRPLFTIDLMKTMTDEEFMYSTMPINFVQIPLLVFDKALEEIGRIFDLEPKILSDLYKSQKQEVFIKAPQKPKTKPRLVAEFDEENRSEGLKLPDENLWIWNLYYNLESKLEIAIEPLQRYLEAFSIHKDVLKMNPYEYVRKIEMEETPIEIEDIRKEVIQILNKEKELKSHIKEEMHVSIFNIQCKELLSYLSDKYATLAKNLTDLIAKRCREQTQQIFNTFEIYQNKIRQNPKDIEQLTDIKDYMSTLPNEIEKIKVEINKVLEIYKILEDFNYRFKQVDMEKRWLVFGGPKKVMEQVEEQKGKLEKLKNKFKEELSFKQDEFKLEIETLESSIQKFDQFQSLAQHAQYAEDVRNINESLQKCAENARTFNYHESLFDQEQTDYSKLQGLQRDFQPFSNLWLTISTWSNDNGKWLKQDWEQLNAAAVEKFVDEGSKTLTGVIRYFKERDMDKMVKIAQTIKEQMEKFKPKVPLMVSLRKRGMKERHWQQISEKIGFVIQPSEGFNFQMILDMGMEKFTDICVEIGDRANKEFQIEEMLTSMKTQWESINFQVKILEYKGQKGGPYIIRGYDDIQQVLDEHLVNTQAMQFSLFKGPFEQDILQWNEELKRTSDILEEWAKCQGQWMYLQPIFDAPDIAKQLPQETKKFKTVDSTWRHTMQQASALQNVLKVCAGTDGLLERLQEANKNLEFIQKELNNYLEKKREKFARFYFLSNDDLLEILSQTKEPLAVQPHLKKVFENINQVQFTDQKKILAMFSAENEKIEFVNIIDPNNKNVEVWMCELESQMQISVRFQLLKAIENYPERDCENRCKWVFEHPGQCILNGSQVRWTSEVEDAIKGGAQELSNYVTLQNDQIMGLVGLVRQKLSKQKSVTLNALIVLDVHAKDVVTKMVEKKVTDRGSFEWISQLRYYWEKDDCYVKQIQTNFPYGYEYLGNTLRLVITPLTDKCYMTLMGALKLQLGGAPAGPAGTGKTESTKDLAKALAKQCVVFNCSDSMDYIMLGKFFKGLASAGAWCCFDEFNRINIEVLSVIAMQLQQLFGEKAKGTPRIMFEGSDIKLSPTFSVFVTMNPGYAGRTELPDNLKALFRSVAMMVPDYALIGEILLYSFGFQKGRELAKKMVTTFKLSSEQLSSQDHYDYGMRAVRSVINAAGLLKSADPDNDEDQLLLRALRDVNVPKFLKDDIPLFENIISDLFPNLTRQKIDYGKLLENINEQCKKAKLQPAKPFVEKVIQLYDTTQVRHGLMLVGPTGGGKTSNYNILQKALTSLQKEGYYKVHTHILNPKSIKMGQLYGQFNEQTHEWTDGILAYIIRQNVKDTTEDRHWVVFDGPVDSLWIESMNTVLDDNKKLCLNSGQILQLTPYMTMFFEVEDLAVASPATVSRCGMVYQEPISLGLRPLFQSWVETLAENFLNNKHFLAKLNRLYDDYVEPTVKFLRNSKNELKECIQTCDNNIVQSLFRLINCFLADYQDSEIKKVTQEEVKKVETILEALWIFYITWSLCCTVDLQSRQKMDIFLRNQMKEKKFQFVLPENGTIYDFYFNAEEEKFFSWKDMFKEFKIEQKAQFHEISVPTSDSTRNTYISRTLLLNKFHVLCPGPTGSGKSQNLYNLLIKGMPETYQYIAMTFSAQTSSNQTQDTIDAKMGKRRKGIYGPDLGKKCIIFVDDLNMPKKEEFGAQPPIELLRQFLGHQGWYNRKDMSFIVLEDLIFLSAMGPPGGGRSAITSRLIRHYNILAYTELDDETIKHIFLTLSQNFLMKFGEIIKGLINQSVDSIMDVYNKCRQELLPIPSKSHYTFNMRDIWKVTSGICNSSQKFVSTKQDFVRLWYHENLRVFHDRLNCEEDREFIKTQLKQIYEQQFMCPEEEIMNQERILFGDFWQGRDIEPRNYQQITNIGMLMSKMERFQEDFNSDPHFSGGGKKNMLLVMFLDACEHICRITRIIRQPAGNALLLGVGGSGRQSLSKISTFIANYKIFQIEVVKGYQMKHWREDIKKCLLQAGIENKPITFLFVDTQIINEQMLEDLNNILNSGDVTGLYNEKDLEEITTACKPDCVKKGLVPDKMNIFQQYLIRVKKNIHIIIAMSPLGEIFVNRLRMFPSLVNCCTINWFSEWPDEALLGVGKGQLIDYEQELGIEGQIPKIVEMMKTIHKSVEKTSIQYYNECRRRNYVTPTSFLELLKLYRKILDDKREELDQQYKRLQSGLDKLESANVAVKELKIQLQEKQPLLEKASEETDKMMEKLKIQKEQAEQQQKIVALDEKEAAKSQQEASELAFQAELKVKDANLALEASLKEVDKIEKGHLDEVKSFANPAFVIRLVCQGVIILCEDIIKKNGGQIIIKNVPGSLGQKEADYFETAKKYLLKDPKELLSMLKSYKKEEMKASQIAKLESQLFSQQKFNFQDAKQASLPIGYLFNWVKAMRDYFVIFTETQPLREQLQELNKIVEQKTTELKLKKVALQKINNEIKALQEEFDRNIQQKEKLKEEIMLCETKLERAQKLTELLSDEKVRWGEEIKKIDETRYYLSGNSIIGSGMVAYSGPFTAQYRSQLEQNWVEMLKDLQIQHSKGIKMVNFLGNDVKIQQWNIAKLPKDDTSIENGIIIDCCERWPLMIDPQNQANKFIKNLAKEHVEGYDIMKIGESNMMKNIELALQFGKWILLENVGEELDPALEPILLKQVTKTGSSYSIIIGEKTIPYNEEKFRFYMTTTHPNPHYSPETSVKITLINFAITEKGLVDQMLAKVVGLENPNLEQKKEEIVRKNAQDRKALLDTEDSILKTLSETSSDISETLKNENLINQLQTSKKFAAEINQRVKDSKITEAQIDQAREGYQPVAIRASILFFTIIDLSIIDPMYQYSLQYFEQLFEKGVENAVASKELEKRLENINNYFTYSLYENICRSLFEKHKLLLSFSICIKIMQNLNQINQEEWRYLLAGPSGEIKIQNNPTSWFPDNQWMDLYKQLYAMNQLEAFQGILKQFMEFPDEWKEIFDSSSPNELPLPNPWEQKLSQYQKLIVLKAFRSDKLIPAIQNFVSKNLGENFIKIPAFEIAKSYKDSTIQSPLIIILSPGSDPVSDFMKFAEEMNMLKRLDSISLGQGQGKKAAEKIKEGQQRGGWVLLQNCHLSISWMPELENLVEEISESTHKDFRLWLTSMPSNKFPISVLQNGVKMTIEPPQGVRNNLYRTYMNLDDKELSDCSKPEPYKKLLFGFALFHAIIQDRRKFGPIGWNIPYEFTNEDLLVCRKQLKMLLNDYKEVPYVVLNFLGAEINYGGRVTDDKDERLIKAILKVYIDKMTLRDGQKFSKSGIYQSIPAGTQQDYLTYIESLPLHTDPEVYGLHDNAEITNAQNQCRNILESLLSIQPRASTGLGKSREEIISELATNIEKRTQQPFNIEKVAEKYPTKYEESMNTVLFQEIIRYNRLLQVMHDSLGKVKKALKGYIVMSEDLEKLANSLFDNFVPKAWSEIGFLSLKPLASWFDDLEQRIKFLSSWYENGTPNYFWISGFFFPQAFVTGTLQNFARKYQIAIDLVQVQCIILDEMTYKDIKEGPEDGVYVYGMFLEGARWDARKHFLGPSKPKELFSDLPLMHWKPFKPEIKQDELEEEQQQGEEKKIEEEQKKEEKKQQKVAQQQPELIIYKTPLYKVVSRAGTLSTTGHSTNFVMFIDLPSKDDEDIWVRAGVAAFLALRY